MQKDNNDAHAITFVSGLLESLQDLPEKQLGADGVAAFLEARIQEFFAQNELTQEQLTFLSQYFSVLNNYALELKDLDFSNPFMPTENKEYLAIRNFIVETHHKDVSVQSKKLHRGFESFNSLAESTTMDILTRLQTVSHCVLAQKNISDRSNVLSDEKNEAHFKNGIKEAVLINSTASQYRDTYKRYEQHAKKDFTFRLKRKWQSTDRGWKIMAGMGIGLGVAAVVAAAIIFPPSLLITIPAVGAVTAVTATAASSVVVAGVSGIALATAVANAEVNQPEKAGLYYPQFFNCEHCASGDVSSADELSEFDDVDLSGDNNYNVSFDENGYGVRHGVATETRVSEDDSGDTPAPSVPLSQAVHTGLFASLADKAENLADKASDKLHAAQPRFSAG